VEQLIAVSRRQVRADSLLCLPPLPHQSPPPPPSPGHTPSTAVENKRFFRKPNPVLLGVLSGFGSFGVNLRFAKRPNLMGFGISMDFQLLE